MPFKFFTRIPFPIKPLIPQIEKLSAEKQSTKFKMLFQQLNSIRLEKSSNNFIRVLKQGIFSLALKCQLTNKSVLTNKIVVNKQHIFFQLQSTKF